MNSNSRNYFKNNKTCFESSHLYSFNICRQENREVQYYKIYMVSQFFHISRYNGEIYRLYEIPGAGYITSGGRKEDVFKLLKLSAAQPLRIFEC